MAVRCSQGLVLALALAVFVVPDSAGADTGVGEDSLTFTIGTPVRLVAGTPGTVKVLIENNGVSAVDVTVRLRSPPTPDGWRTTIEPESRALKLQPGTSRMVEFGATAQGGAAPADLEGELIARWSEVGLLQDKRQAFPIEVREATTSVVTAGSPATILAGTGTVVAMGVVGAAGGLAAASIGARVRRTGWWGLLPFYALYSRIRRSDVLRHEKRRRLYEIITAEPGVRFSEIQQRTELPNGVLYHHLKILEEHRFITSTRVGGQRRFTPVGVPAQERRQLTRTEEKILDLIPRFGITQQELSDLLEVTRQGVNYHIKSLEAKGAVEQRVVDGEWRCFRTPRTRSDSDGE